MPGCLFEAGLNATKDQIKKEVEKDIHEILINLTIKVVREELAAPAPVATCCVLKQTVKHHKLTVKHKCTKVITVPCP